MKKKRIILITLVFTLLICFFCFLPKEKSVSKKIKTISYEHPEYKERYTLYKSKHPHLTKEEIITLVNMNRDYDFYDHIIKQEHPNDLNTIVNKYYQLDENYAPDDLVGHNIIVVANLKPATLCGVESCGMILAADSGDGVKVIFADDVDIGSKVR